MGLPFGISPTRMFNFCVEQYLQWRGLRYSLLELGNGTTMATWAPKKRTHKPSLVLLHAFGLNSLTWAHQVAGFTTAFDLFIPDLLFSGKSFTTDTGRSEIFQAECVFKLLQSLDVHEFSVVGTSYGGFVAYRMAHMYPNSVNKLVLSSSAVNMTREADAAMVRRFKTKDVAEILQPSDVEGVRRTSVLAFHWQPPFTIPAFLCNDILDVLFNVNRKEKLELLKNLQLNRADVPLPKVAQEALLIWGEHDPVFDITYARRLQEWIGDKAELVILKDAAHVPQAEQYRNYNAKVLEFLTRPLQCR